jgi:opacity protein-like surface antigen
MGNTTGARLAGILVLLAATTAVGPALAQDANGHAAQGVAAAPDATDGDAFCRDHWLAVDRCRDKRRWTGPELMLGVDLGVSAMNETGPFGFNDGVGGVTSPGPAWGLRVGVELFSWLAVEARYMGMYDSIKASVSPTGSAGLFTSVGAAALRLTAPLPYVHPYVLGGIGYYDVAQTGSSGSELHSSSQAGMLWGVGFDVPLTYHLSVGAEADYHYQIHESFSSITTNGIDGGDLSTFTAVLRARL